MRTQKNIEEAECIICHKTMIRKMVVRTQRLPNGVLAKNRVTCSKKCSRKLRDFRKDTSNINKANNTHHFLNRKELGAGETRQSVNIAPSSQSVQNTSEVKE